MTKENKEDLRKEPLPFRETWWKHLIAGGLSGAVSRSMTAPIDRLKVLAQVSGTSFGLVSGLSGIVKKEGFFALWRGNGINVVKIIPEFATKFMSYELGKLAILDLESGRPLTVVDRFAAAGTAGVISQTVVYPIEVMKTRVVVQHGRGGQKVLRLFREMIQKVGYKSLLRGYPSAMGGILLFTGTDLCVYETVKKRLRSRFGYPDILPPQLTVACAVISCVTGQFVAYPLSMASTTVQVADNLETTARSVLGERFKRDGLLGLYRGAAMTYTKAIPAVIITYLVYEYVLWNLGANMTS